MRRCPPCFRPDRPRCRVRTLPPVSIKANAGKADGTERSLLELEDRGQQARHLPREIRRAESPPLASAPRLPPIPTLSRQVAKLIDERWTDEGARWSHCRIGSMSLTDELALRSCKCATQPRVRTRDTDQVVTRTTERGVHQPPCLTGCGLLTSLRV